jgi:WD40 repeat protein
MHCLPPTTHRLWDVNAGRCRQVLRGHMDSVNDVAWQPYGAAISTGGTLAAQGPVICTCNLTYLPHHTHIAAAAVAGTKNSILKLCPITHSTQTPPASSDKTVSAWDPRSGLSVQTYYGHGNSVNGVAYALAGGTIASTDAGEAAWRCLACISLWCGGWSVGACLSFL